MLKQKFLAVSLNFLLFSFIALLSATPALAAEQINLFTSKININSDTSISVQEIINYETDEEKHGIFRYIPIRYSHDGANYTARVTDISVNDDSQDSLQFSQSRDSNNLVLKIGDPDETFTGKMTYVIEYKVENAIQQVENIPELYWDITGEGWTIPIVESEAFVESSWTAITTAHCFSGPFGGNDELCRAELIDKNQARFVYSQTINYNDNFTVLAKLDPQGGLLFPSRWEKLSKQIEDNWRLLPLLLPGLIMAYWWWHRGRDTAFTSWNVFNHDNNQPQSLLSPWQWRPTPMVYEPVKELTPGEAGALLDERVDNQDVVAEITELARLKFLKIERVETKKLFGADTDYLFIKLKDSTSKLTDYQQYLLEHIFETGDKVKLSDLRGTFYLAMAQAKKLIYDSLFAKKLFTDNPQKVKGLAFGAAIALTFPAGFLLFWLLEQGLYLAIPLAIISEVIAFGAAFFMPAKTAKGTNLALQSKGLRATIARGAWREKIKEKHLFFEEVLPFAIALGVAKQLSRDMEKLNVTAPNYVPTSHGWTTGSFVESFSSSAASGLAFNPNSSSSSSSSGGGSSGGGGGGGGGGSW